MPTMTQTDNGVIAVTRKPFSQSVLNHPQLASPDHLRKMRLRNIENHCDEEVMEMESHVYENLHDVSHARKRESIGRLRHKQSRGLSGLLISIRDWAFGLAA